MSYYARGNGRLVLKSGAKIPQEILDRLASQFDEVADSPDGGLWLSKCYADYDEREIIHGLVAVAPYVESGNVEFDGDDDICWRFHFDKGTVREQNGRIIYEDDINDRRIQHEEVCGHLVDVVEEWLRNRGFTAKDFPNDDREDGDGTLVLGIDAATLMDNFKEVLVEEEIWTE